MNPSDRRGDDATSPRHGLPASTGPDVSPSSHPTAIDPPGQSSRRLYARDVTATVRLAGPVVAAQLAQMSMGLTDVIMVGRLGEEALAGIALGNAVFVFLSLSGMGVMMAVGPMVSQAHGSGRKEPIGRSVRQGFWVGLMLAIPSVILLSSLEPILMAAGQPEQTVAHAMRYLHAIKWGYLPFLWLMVLRCFVEGISRPWPVTIITACGVLLNVAANSVLIYGKLGFPAMGIAGTGWASTIVFWFLILALTTYIQIVPTLRSYAVFTTIGRPDPVYFRRLFQIGWPIGVALGIESGLFTCTALLMGRIGPTALAAHQVALQCAAFAFMVPLGVGMAAAVRVGHAVGRGDRRGVRRAGFIGVALAASFMILAALCFVIFPHTIIRLFLDASDPGNEAVVSLAVTLLGIAAVFQVFDGIQVSAAGSLRGLKDTRRPMLIGFVSYWLVGLTAGYALAFVFGFGAPGLWWGLVLGLATASVLLSWRFHRLSKSHPPPESEPLHRR